MTWYSWRYDVICDLWTVDDRSKEHFFESGTYKARISTNLFEIVVFQSWMLSIDIKTSHCWLAGYFIWVTLIQTMTLRYLPGEFIRPSSKWSEVYLVTHSPKSNEWGFPFERWALVTNAISGVQKYGVTLEKSMLKFWKKVVLENLITAHSRRQTQSWLANQKCPG